MGIRQLRATLLVLPALVVGLACTAILNPRDDVQRCGSAGDCEGTNDNRYVVECVFPEGSTLDSTEVDKVCVAAFKGQSCDPMGLSNGNTDHPLLAAYEALRSSTRYACEDAQFGTLGCPPEAATGGCQAGLTVNDNGVCDDGDGQPAIYMLDFEPDLYGQDVLDQYCRSFFCDNEFACDTETFTCRKCVEDAAFGNGGCGEVYVAGAPSCVYTPNVEDVCDGPDALSDEPKFGCTTP